MQYEIFGEFFPGVEKLRTVKLISLFLKTLKGDDLHLGRERETFGKT